MPDFDEWRHQVRLAIVQIAASTLAGSDVVRWRWRRVAELEAMRTPRLERAPRWQLRKIWNGTLDRAQALPRRSARNRFEQALRIGVFRRFENLPHRPFLDDPPRVHDGDAVGMPGDDPEVVGDEHEREIEFLLHLLQQIENLRLNRDVECRRRLVGDEQQRLAGKRDGDQHALPHAS